jgi:5-methylcytosine-specific restriction endonuclease McrA
MEARPPSLQKFLDSYLPTVRVGIDFGEHAGGVAVVKNNEILHAETFIDFHKATLEERRTLRRSRRTRHAKKMRLARLRSWVLRQKLPNGDRLPDPYLILRDPRFHVQPGLFKTQGRNPLNSSSWVERAKQGKADPAEFVRAVTLIFQKRGYKYDDRGLSELKDIELKDFLESARIPPQASDFRQDVERELKRREENSDDPSRGRKKIPLAELTALYDQACNRQHQPRIAEPRSVKEADLRAVIEGFGKNAGLSEETIQTWKRDLVGTRDSADKHRHYGLLNTVLRPARFDNRIRSGCSWCGKKTPRKARVRELAYRAAVHNLRGRDGWRDRPLTNEETQVFLEWWHDREKAPGLATLKRRLNTLNPRQARMANQLYDLLKNTDPKGRTNLCEQHLEMAAQGKTMKDAGVDWQTISERNAPNPQREHHDQRVLHRLEQILFVKGKHGPEAWRHGPVSILSLEVPEPQTERARPGQMTQRKEVSFKDRLLNELDGHCVYCGGTASDKDHIFPRANGGPDIWDNLIAACESCNKAKDNRTPFQWMGSDSLKWRSFSTRVSGVPLAPRKKQILLNETDDFPGGDPTPFARVGARPKQFVIEMGNLFTRYGVPPPELHYRIDGCHVQLIRGRQTARLRDSWLVARGGEQNFPAKDRRNLYSHAQDAALVACIPPHTWRDRIFITEGERPGRDGLVVKKTGLAIPELAPNWSAYMAQRRHPIVRVIGNYPVSWKTSFADQSFARNRRDGETGKLRISIPVQQLKAKNLKSLVSKPWRPQFTAFAQEIGLKDNQVFPADKLSERFPHLRSLQLYRQPGGTPVTMHPADGPARQVQIKPASEGVVIWRAEKKIGLSIIRPRPLLRFGESRIDPEIPAGAVLLATLRRHQTIHLPKTKNNPDGFYRVTKFQEGGITFMAESAMPQDIASKLELGRATDDTSEQPASREVVLGKSELAACFAKKTS